MKVKERVKEKLTLQFTRSRSNQGNPGIKSRGDPRNQLVRMFRRNDVIDRIGEDDLVVIEGIVRGSAFCVHV